MAFPNDAWIADPNNAQLYKITYDLVDVPKPGTANANSVLVSQREGWVFVSSYDYKTKQGYVDVFRNTIRVDHIQVGALPVAMTEDSNGTLYVACYNDNTVIKITNPTSTTAVKTTTVIPVSPGPRDITCDSNNVLFVASYNTDKVDVIVKDSVVDSIPVGLAPRAVTCDIANNIWVANYGSNTLSKISKNVKVLDITLGEIAPVDVVTDSSGVVYCANYLGGSGSGGGSVTMIKTDDLGVPVQTVITGIVAPTAIDVVSDDTVYALSEADGCLYRIKNGAISGDPIYVCPNAIAFGDFTGCASYNVFQNIGAGSASPMPPYGMSQMDGQIQKLLNKIINGDVETSADKVSYDSIAYPTVKDALDHMLNVDPIVEVFTADTTPELLTVEYGTTLTSLAIKWKFNKPMASAEIRVGATVLATLDNSSGAVPAEGTATISGFSLPILNNRVLTIVAVDENGTQAAVKQNLTIYCGRRILYGALAPLGTSFPATSDLDNLTKSKLYTDAFNKNFKIDCGTAGDKVPWIAIPNIWGVGGSDTAIGNKSAVVINGVQFTDDAIDKNTVNNYSNGAGGAEDYDVFCLSEDFLLSGTVIMQVLNLDV